MQRQISRRLRQVMTLAVLGALAAGPAFAKDDKKNNHKQYSRDRDHDDGRVQVRFADDQRKTVYEYYNTQIRGGHCPPGLAKKNNGCMPPGHAKRYEIGRPLPRDVIFYDVPQTIIVDLGPPPRGYRYVRVSNDILMLAIGTGMVVDALQNLGTN